MRFASVQSERSSVSAALAEVRAGIDLNPDLVLAFVSPRYGPDVAAVGKTLGQLWPDATVLGCTASGTIGAGLEREGTPALSVTAASLPDTAITPFHIAPGDEAALPDLDPDLDPAFVLLPEPYSCDTAHLTTALDARFPRSPKIGGLVSGGRPGSNLLFLDDEVHRQGAIGVALVGDVRVDTVVAQGCRGIGPAVVVTAVDGNHLQTLDDEPAAEVLQALWRQMEPADRHLFRRSPMIGIAMGTTGTKPTHGDFLIRHIIGVDGTKGVVSVGAKVEEGQVIQFHLRDKLASAHELRQLLGRYARGGDAPAGALLFSCAGRGRGFFGEPDHDSSLFAEHVSPEVPLGGFFCAGEIGPVHGRTFLHAYTSAFGLFRPRGWD